MSKLDDDIRRALAQTEPGYDLDREEGVFREMLGLFHGKQRWMAIVATLYSIVGTILGVLAGIQFFRTDEVRWQIFYATAVLLMFMLVMLVKVWGWMQMNRYALQREIKRLELRTLEQRPQA